MCCCREGLVVLAAAWHPADTPCLVYYCLVMLPDRVSLTSDEISVEVTKHNPAFQVQCSRDVGIMGWYSVDRDMGIMGW